MQPIIIKVHDTFSMSHVRLVFRQTSAGCHVIALQYDHTVVATCTVFVILRLTLSVKVSAWFHRFWGFRLIFKPRSPGFRRTPPLLGERDASNGLKSLLDPVSKITIISNWLAGA